MGECTSAIYFLFTMFHDVVRSVLRSNFILYQLDIRCSGKFLSTKAPENKDGACGAEKMQKLATKLREKTPIGKLDELDEGKHPFQEKEPLPPFPDGVNPSTGEVGGPKGPEPTRFGDWERKGRVTDF